MPVGILNREILKVSNIICPAEIPEYSSQKDVMKSFLKIYFRIRPTIVIYIRTRTEPQLRALLTRRIHHTKIIDARLQYGRLFFLVHFGDAADEHFDFLIFVPLFGGHFFSPTLLLTRVSKAFTYGYATVAIEKMQKLKQMHFEHLHVTIAVYRVQVGIDCGMI